MMVSTHSTDCCVSTCGPGFTDKGGTCPTNYVAKSATSVCKVKQDGTCKTTGPEINAETGGLTQDDFGCCKKTCASSMSELTGAGKCGGNRVAARSTSTERCTDDVCDEEACCPMLCKNAGLTCPTPATEQVRGGEHGSDVTCSETTSENSDKCVIGGRCSCIVGCAAWAANVGGAPRVCSGNNKILSQDTYNACAGNVCDESQCCVDPPGCNEEDSVDTKNTPIGSSNGGCMCGKPPTPTFCATGKYCYDPNDLSGDSAPQCEAAAAPARCGTQGDPGTSFTCDAGTAPNGHTGCNIDNSCTKELCCSMPTCAGEIF
jgi:hypothetical protein